MNAKGYVLLEASVMYVTLSVALVALMPLFILSIRAAKNTEKVAVATHLSSELLEEVRMRKWDENTPTPPQWIASPSATLGVNTGESASDKTTFDDIDDFNGWTEAAVRDPMGNPVPAFAGYSRTVAVQYVNSALSPSASPTDYKQVTVCTGAAKMRPVCLDTVVTNR